jgi:ABC-type ATPase with predicted acetyltransferase domain
MKRKREHFRITKLARHYDKKTDTYTYNIAYETAIAHQTPRTQQINEAFGLGTDQQQKFTIYNNTQLKIRPNDIILITGDSGSGKSVLLKAIKRDLKQQATDINNIKIDKNKPIIETLGKTFQEALETLSKVGLNDAFLFLRTYKQLSDGQKTRYKIAKLTETQAQYWIIDEFTNTLDRDTAKTVAYNLQKQARQQNKAVIAATTHTDLLQDLKPSVHIHKQFGKQITINCYPNKPAKQCSLTREMRIQQGTTEDWKKLASHHYRSHKITAPRKIFTLKRKEELCGVIVYSYPPPTCFGRNHVLPKMQMKQLNQQLSIISRIVIHPKYRTIGLGTKLIKETLNKAGTQYVEMPAVMAKYNPFAEKAGMRKIAEQKPPKQAQKITETLQQLGFNTQTLANQKQVLQQLQSLNETDQNKIRKTLSDNAHIRLMKYFQPNEPFGKKQQYRTEIEKASLEKLSSQIKICSFLMQTKAYLFWSKTRKKKKKGEEFG